ncbi:uncharacterized protein VTP21DRAFT_8550 [Calcarisporiella thermophila]|uniref:uncharacterized protein n=1 Tax=Calcarisporiella thermophila TaxID=911321 RepID=UPI003742CCA0
MEASQNTSTTKQTDSVSNSSLKESTETVELDITNTISTNSNESYADSTASRLAKKWRWWATLLLCYLMFLFVGSDDGTFGLVLPQVRKYYSLNDSQVSLAFLSDLAGYLLGSMLTGFLVNRLGFKRYLILGEGLFLVATFCLALVAPRLPFFSFMLSMVVSGASIATLDTGIHSFMLSLPNGARLLTWLHAAYGLGAWAGPAAFTLLIDNANMQWNTIYLLLGSAGVAIFLGLAVVFIERRNWENPSMDTQDSETTAVDATGTEEGEEKGNGEKIRVEEVEEIEEQSNLLLAVFKYLHVWLCALMFFFYMGAEVSLGSWSYNFLTVAREYPVAISGQIAGIYWLGLMIGSVGLGHLSPKVGSFRVVFIGLLIHVVALLTLWFIVPIVPSTEGGEALSGIALFLTGLGLGPIYPTLMIVLCSEIPLRLRGSAIGLVTGFASLGQGIFSWIAGVLADFAGPMTLLPLELGLAGVMAALGVTIMWRKQNKHRKRVREASGV